MNLSSTATMRLKTRPWPLSQVSVSGRPGASRSPSAFHSLKGARIDDVSLKNYHETVSDESPRIVLLSPTGSANPYYAEFVAHGEHELVVHGDDALEDKALAVVPGQRQRPAG
jgi:hypothetical protein